MSRYDRPCARSASSSRSRSRQSPQRIARALQTAVFVGKAPAGETRVSCAASQGIQRARPRWRSRAACAATVNSQPRRLVVSPPASRCRSSFRNVSWTHVLRVLVVPHEDRGEAIDRSAVGLELLPDLLRRVHPASHAV